jgi:hypothetical protein
MSREARRIRREAERREVKAMHRAVLEEARSHGCVCPAGSLRVERRDGYWYAAVRHPEWCPAAVMLAERGLLGERTLLAYRLEERAA